MESLLKRVPSPAPRQTTVPNHAPAGGKLPTVVAAGIPSSSSSLTLLGNAWTITNLPEKLTAALKQRNWNSAQRKQLTDVISAAKVFREETLRSSGPKNSEHLMLEEAVLQRGIIRSDLDLPPPQASMTLARMFKHHRIPPKYRQRIIDEATPGGGDGFMRLLEGIAARQPTNANNDATLAISPGTRTGSPEGFKKGKEGEAVVRWTDDDDGMCVLTVEELGSLSHLFGIQHDEDTSLPLDLRATSPQSPSRALSTPLRSSSRSFHYKNLDATEFDSQSNMDNINDSASMASRRGTLTALGGLTSPTTREFTSSRQSGLGRTTPTTLRHELMFAKAEALFSESRELFNNTQGGEQACDVSSQGATLRLQQTHHHHHTIGEMSHHHPPRKGALSPVPLAPPRYAICDGSGAGVIATTPSPNTKLRAVTEAKIRQESLQELKAIADEKRKLLVRKRMSKLMHPLTLSEAAETTYRPIPEAERERCDRAWRYNDEYWFLDEEKFRQDAQAAQIQREGSTTTSATRERRDPDCQGGPGTAPLQAQCRLPDDDDIVWTMSGPQYRTEAERMFLAVQRTKASAHVRAQEIANRTRGEILTVRSSGATLFRSGSPQPTKAEERSVNRSPKRVSPILRGRLAELSVPRVHSPPPPGSSLSTAEDFQNRRERDAALRRESEESARHVAIPVFLNIRAFA